MRNFKPFLWLDKLFFYFLIVALVPLVSMGVFNYSKSKAALKKQILFGLEDVTYGASDRIGQPMNTAYVDVQQWAELNIVKETLTYGYFGMTNELFRSDLTFGYKDKGLGEINIKNVRKFLAFHKTHAFQGVKPFGWTSVAFVDSEKPLKPINTLKYKILIFVLLASGLISIIFYFMIKRLRETEKWYRMVLNNANDAVFVYQPTAEDTPGKFIEVNDVA